MTEQEKLHDSAEYKKMRSQQLYCFEAPELMGRDRARGTLVQRCHAPYVC